MSDPQFPFMQNLTLYNIFKPHTRDFDIFIGDQGNIREVTTSQFVYDFRFSVFS